MAFFALRPLERTHLDGATQTLYFRGFTPVFIGPCRAIRALDHRARSIGSTAVIGMPNNLRNRQ